MKYVSPIAYKVLTRTNMVGTSRVKSNRVITFWLSKCLCTAT